MDSKLTAQKIVLIVSSMNCGGAERVAATLVNAWAANGRNVCLIIAYSKKQLSFYDISKEVEVIYLADCVTPSKILPYHYIKRLFALRKLIKSFQPDVVISFLSNVIVMTVMATRFLQLRLVGCEHITPSYKVDIGVLLEFMRRLTYPRADAITLLGQDMVAMFRNMIPNIRHIEVIPNPIPVGIEAIQRSNVGSQKRYRLVAAGRFADQKKFDVLVNCFAELAADFPDWDLVIFGEGPLYANITELVALHNLPHRIFLPGQSSIIWQELIDSDVFVLSSLFEGFPMVLLEAMALGLPCVAFDCPNGPKEMLLDGELGLLVPHQDKSALIDSLRRIMSDKELREELGQKALASIWERYSIDMLLKKWDDLFEKIIDAHK